MKYNNKKIYLSISLAFFFFLILINPLNAQSNLTKDTSELATAAALADLPAYLRALYKIGISVVVGLATVVMMWGGLQWIMAGGNMSRVENAKNLIYGSILGLVIALSSFVLLNTINPQLITPTISTPTSIKDSGALTTATLCCAKLDDEGNIDDDEDPIVLQGKYGETCEGIGLITLPNNNLCKGDLGDRCNKDRDCVNFCPPSQSGKVTYLKCKRKNKSTFTCQQKTGPANSHEANDQCF